MPASPVALLNLSLCYLPQQQHPHFRAFLRNRSGRHLGLRPWYRCGAQLPPAALPLVDYRTALLGHDLDL